MGLHPRVRMMKILHWLERKRKGKGRNLNPNYNPIKGARIRTYPKSSALIMMNSGNILQSFHTRRQERRPQEE